MGASCQNHYAGIPWGDWGSEPISMRLNASSFDEALSPIDEGSSLPHMDEAGRLILMRPMGLIGVHIFEMLSS